MPQTVPDRSEYAAVRALVIGLAREGTAVARHLAERGAKVVATDLKPASQMDSALSALAGLPVSYVLGEHPLQLLDGVDVVFVSPGVPGTNPLLVAAQQRALPLSSETRLFTRLCPAPVIGITGSSGKTTTTALTGEMIRASGRRTWVGGNIGQPLLPHLDTITATDLVVMELSSFQLELLGRPIGEGVPAPPHLSTCRLLDPDGWSPQIAAVLNITPNHLDRYPSMDAYVAAKAQILAHQKGEETCVLGWDDRETRRLGDMARSRRVLWFSLLDEVEEGAFLREELLVLRMGERERAFCRRDELRLLGSHNVANVLAASALAAAAGTPVEAIRHAARGFSGVEHRLELVREQGGVRWYNDSIATTPERTIAALNSFDAPVVLLAGGRDKHLPWADMADLTWRRAKHLILFGEAAGLIEQEMQRSPAAGGRCQIHRCSGLDDAVRRAASLAEAGDVVLLSPGGTSFDAYPDFSARGAHFRRLVVSLEQG